jgi:NAD(P)-dependent dehydrogenase (short-subunit alcohol dehydrogenase family)
MKLEILFDVRGKTVLITGGSAGIGAMIARAYVENGARVYISSRKAEACLQLESELSNLGYCKALPSDLGTLIGVNELQSQFSKCENKLDILVNNAGATWGQSIDDYSEEGWDKVVDLNLKSVFFLTQSLLPYLREGTAANRYAKVINIASVNGLQPPLLETYAYSASKAGCIMLTRHLAKRLADERILVNAIAPGPFATKMMAATLAERGEIIKSAVPLGRVGEPEDIAGVALFLGSRASDYTTGAVIPCDGGSAEL